jgi:cell division protein FtsZ
MSINLSLPQTEEAVELKPRITVIGVGGAGCNAVNNMIRSQLEGVDFLVANTDAQSLRQSRADRRIQLGTHVTQGLGAGSRPDIGRAAAEEAIDEIAGEFKSVNMVFIAAGMGGGTGTGAAPVIARAAREMGILTVGVVTKPFHFEGSRRMRLAESGIQELEQYVDSLIIIPNQNLFRIANEKTTFADAFAMADEVLYSGVRSVTDLMVMPGLINLDFADVRAVMSEMGKAMMGSGEASGDRRALDAAEAAIANPLLDDTSMKGAKGVLINITGGNDMTLFEVDEAANRIRAEVDEEAFIIFGSAFDESLNGRIRVSVVATGINGEAVARPVPTPMAAFERPARLHVVRPEPKPAPVESKEPAVAKAEPPAPAPAAPAETAASAAMASAAEKAIVETPSPAAAASPAPVTPAAEPARTASAAVNAPRPAGIPALGAADAFIPPAPAEASGARAALNPDPFAVADMVNRPREAPAPVPKAKEAPSTPAKPKAPSLFERVVGISRARSEPIPMERAKPPAAEAKAQAPVGPTPLRASPEERALASQPDDDLLDIPAFLRRQAN